MKPTGIILHCTANHKAYGSELDVIYREHVQNQKFDCIGYHFVVTSDGRIFYTRPLDKQGAHCYGHNDTIGIAYFGGIDDKGNPCMTMTSKQVKSYMEVMHLCIIAYGFTLDNVKLHNEYAAKACPSFNRTDLYALYRAYFYLSDMFSIIYSPEQAMKKLLSYPKYVYPENKG